MKIIDKHKNPKVYFKSELSQGEVYKDMSGNLLLATDENAAVHLADGALYDLKSDKWYVDSSQFTLMSVVLEVQ